MSNTTKKTSTGSDKQIDHAAIDASITQRQEVSGIGAVMRTQPFWVFLAILCIAAVMTYVSDAFMTERNMFNITRNFAFFGMTCLLVLCLDYAQLPSGSPCRQAGESNWGLLSACSPLPLSASSMDF